MPKSKLFILNDKTFEGKYKIAMELEKHYERLNEIKHNSKFKAVDNELPKSISDSLQSNRNKYKNESLKYKLVEQQKENLLLYHRLNEIRNAPSYTTKYINSNKQLNIKKFKNRVNKIQNKIKKKKRIKENSITKKHIREMIASDDLRLDELKKHWRNHLKRKKVCVNLRKRQNMKPQKIKKMVDSITNRIVSKSPRYSKKNNNNNNKSPKIPKLNTKIIKHKSKAKTTRCNSSSPNKKILRKCNSQRSRVDKIMSARRTVLSPADILGANKDQVIEHSKYLQNKTKLSHTNSNTNSHNHYKFDTKYKTMAKSKSTSGIEVYLDVDTVSSLSHRNNRKYDYDTKHISRSQYLYKAHERS